MTRVISFVHNFVVSIRVQVRALLLACLPSSVWASRALIRIIVIEAWHTHSSVHFTVTLASATYTSPTQHERLCAIQPGFAAG